MWKERIDRVRTWLAAYFKPVIDQFHGPLLHETLTLPFLEATLADGTTIAFALSNPSSVEAMVAIERETYNGSAMWGAADFYEDMMYQPHTFYVQAYVGARTLVGFIGCRRDQTSVHISNLAVRPAFQQRGIGTLLMQQVKALLPALSADAITLEVRVSNATAQRFYAREGFMIERVREQYYDDNHEDAYWMAWYAAAQAAGPRTESLGKENDGTNFCN